MLTGGETVLVLERATIAGSGAGSDNGGDGTSGTRAG